MIPKNFPIQIDTDQLIAFRKAITEGPEAEQTFIGNCLNHYKDISEISNKEDIYSLLLIKSVLKSDAELVKHILQQKHEGNILVHYDAGGNSRIYTSLLFQDSAILGLFKGYLQVNGEKLEKAELSDGECNAISNVILSSKYTKTFWDEFIQPICNEETINKLMDIIGEDSIYDTTY